MPAEQMITGNEPGEVDNRLTLNPNDDRWADYIEDWEDGNEYSMTVKVRQVSPGEFEVIEADVEESEDMEEPEEEEAPKKAEGKTGKSTKGISNPAIIALIGTKK